MFRRFPTVFLDHISDKRLYELKPFVFLGAGIKKVCLHLLAGRRVVTR